MYRVYWTDSTKPYAKDFEPMKEALQFSQELRNSKKYTFITMVCEDANIVGQSGVDSVVNGKLPDGNNYEWKKRRI